MVTASSIGYGDITPASQAGKFFSIFYLLVSTVVVAGILGGVIELFVDDTLEAKLIEDIIDSDVYSYRCDISQDFHISKTDFVSVIIRKQSYTLRRRYQELLIRLSNSCCELLFCDRSSLRCTS